MLLSGFIGLSMLTGCSSSTTSEVEKDAEGTVADVEEGIDEAIESVEKTGIDNSVDLVSQYDSLVTKVEDNLTKGTYHNDEYDIDIPYGVYVPEGYDSGKEYPLVMFIPDSSLVGQDVEAILKQGYGGVVWASDEVQTGNPAIILYPAYPSVTVDDHNGYEITSYVPATIGLIDQIKEEYSIDESRVYATGQSMGAMMSMILMAENPDYFTAAMIVDGQWDPEALKPLYDQKFVYFAAQDDTSAFTGMSEEIPVWEEAGANIVQKEWSGKWDQQELEDAAHEMFDESSNIYCVSWETGTVTPKEMGFGNMQGGSGDMPFKGGGPQGGDQSGMSNGGMIAEGSTDVISDTDTGEDTDPQMNMGDNSSGMSSVGYHMASFDYAYKCNVVVGWLLLQHK